MLIGPERNVTPCKLTRFQVTVPDISVCAQRAGGQFGTSGSEPCYPVNAAPLAMPFHGQHCRKKPSASHIKTR